MSFIKLTNGKAVEAKVEVLFKILVEATREVGHELSYDEAVRIPELPESPNYYAYYFRSFSEAANDAWKKVKREKEKSTKEGASIEKEARAPNQETKAKEEKQEQEVKDVSKGGNTYSEDEKEYQWSLVLDLVKRRGGYVPTRRHLEKDANINVKYMLDVLANGDFNRFIVLLKKKVKEVGITPEAFKEGKKKKKEVEEMGGWRFDREETLHDLRRYYEDHEGKFPKSSVLNLRGLGSEGYPGIRTWGTMIKYLGPAEGWFDLIYPEEKEIEEESENTEVEEVMEAESEANESEESEEADEDFEEIPDEEEKIEEEDEEMEEMKREDEVVEIKEEGGRIESGADLALEMNRLVFQLITASKQMVDIEQGMIDIALKVKDCEESIMVYVQF